VERGTGAVDRLFSELACYPERALELVTTWREAGASENFVRKLSFQRSTDPGIARQFAEVPGRVVTNLCANCHGMSW
jgi:23S rRNA (cytidine2498-2'-O)-methyltransferase